MPPDFNSTWDIMKLRENIVPNLNKKNLKQFYKIIGQRSKIMLKCDYIVIGLPILNGNWALFGYKFTYEPIRKRDRRNRKVAVIQIHPLVQIPKNLKMQPTQIRRWRPHHLLNRTGGNFSLSDKHVVVIGTGAIGSKVAMRFAKAGVKQLTIIDHDWMEMDNIYRHSLGYDHVYQKFPDGILNKAKVRALKEEINRRYPFSLVSALINPFDKVYQDNLVDWASIHLVIIAIGSPNQEMEIDERFHGRTNSPPIIYTWVEPIGIGGHVLVTLNGVKEGCYQCLSSRMAIIQSIIDLPLLNHFNPLLDQLQVVDQHLLPIAS
ncbi:thiF family protein [Brevibacillus laterosporus GI-9]|nr:thiF family protein [Brevibacillus laterosporus GI-9]